MHRILLAALLFAPAACKDSKTFESVEVLGLPCPDGRLTEPLLLEMKHAGGIMKMTYAGGHGVKTEASLEKDTKQTVTVRVGKCSAAGDCREPRWLAEPQTVTLDTHDPNVQLAVIAPGEHACTK